MASTTRRPMYNVDERVSDLAKEALELSISGNLEESQRKLRQAIAIKPDNPDVKAAFEKIAKDGDSPHLVRLCRRLLEARDRDAGKDASRLLNSTSFQISKDVGEQCMKLLLDFGEMNPEDLHNIRDEIVALLIPKSSGARRFLASELERSVSQVFEKVYAFGDGSANILSSDVLDAPSWPSEKVRRSVERDIFQLFLAKHMESGDDYDGRAIKGIARIMAADAEKVKDLIDHQSVDTILSDLDQRAPLKIRSQATLTIAKYLEVAGKDGEDNLTNFILKRVEGQKTEELILAFSAAAAIFPLIPKTGANLLLSGGFLDSLVSSMEPQPKSASLVQAALEMLSAACIESTCRKEISKSCTSWLELIINSGNEARAGLAAMILAKLRGSPVPSETEKNTASSTSVTVESLVERFKKTVIDDDESTLQNSIEGLSYTSMRPNVKAELAKDAEFLKRLIDELSRYIDKPTLLFGGLTILNNLTQYPPDLTEEQRRISQLRSYASATKPSEPSPLESDECVSARCKAVVAAGIMPLLVKTSRQSTPTILTLIIQIMLSLSKASTNRGVIAQQGGVKLLLSAYSVIKTSDAAQKSSLAIAAHALARVLISVDPNLVFPLSAPPHPTTAVRPLLTLLPPFKDANDPTIASHPRSLLPAFEALLALTNLASLSPATGVPSLIANLLSPHLNDLFPHNNDLLTRATVQLLCNVCTCEDGLALFLPATSRNSSENAASATTGANPLQRLTILLALTDAEDESTRLGAGGALAMITESPQGCRAVIERPHNNGVKKIMQMCEDDCEGVVMRGIVCVGNICVLEGKLGQGKLMEVGVEGILKGISKSKWSTETKETAKEALKAVQT